MMDITTRSVGPGSITVTMSGELDLAAAGPLSTALTESGATTARKVIVDLSRVGFCDCAGLSALINAYHSVRAGGGQTEFVGIHPTVGQLLHLSGCQWLAGTTAASLADAG